jgi:hypothetical protein
MDDKDNGDGKPSSNKMIMVFVLVICGVICVIIGFVRDYINRTRFGIATGTIIKSDCQGQDGNNCALTVSYTVAKKKYKAVINGLMRLGENIPIDVFYKLGHPSEYVSNVSDYPTNQPSYDNTVPKGGLPFICVGGSSVCCAGILGVFIALL